MLYILRESCPHHKPCMFCKHINIITMQLEWSQQATELRNCFYPTLCTVHVLCTYTQCLFDYSMRMTVTVTGWGVSSKLSCCTSKKTAVKIHPLYHTCTHHWQEWMSMPHPSRFLKAGWTLLGKTEVFTELQCWKLGSSGQLWLAKSKARSKAFSFYK